MSEKHVTVYYFDFCDSNLGVWSRAYFASREEAEAEKATMIEEYGYEEPEELNGSHGDISKVYDEEVELSLEGVVRALCSADPNGY